MTVRTHGDMFDLTGRVAVVTGGGRGLGRSIALGLAGAGADVAIAVGHNMEEGRKTARLITESGRRGLAFRCDVSIEPDVEAMIDQVISEWGTIDVLVNNAGIPGRGKALEFPADEFDRVMAVNVKGVFLCSRAAGRHMLNRGSGSVVNIASVFAVQGMRDRAPYAASKGAVLQLTRSLALEWAEGGVRVNAVGPGYLETPSTHGLLRAGAFRDWVESRVPQGRVLETDDVVGAVIFLASDASKAITGAFLPVDGGWLAG